ncbi:hypothetical protein BH11PLA1_BH11PLA1_13170 [soil metagenome]
MTATLAYTKPWMPYCLFAAGIYNVVWGSVVAVYPRGMWEWLGAPLDRWPDATGMALWQFIGVLIAAFGVGFLAAASNPLRHWPVVLMGLLAKTISLAGLYYAIHVAKTIPHEFGWAAIPNDMIWVLPFALILISAWRAKRDTVEAD